VNINEIEAILGDLPKSVPTLEKIKTMFNFQFFLKTDLRKDRWKLKKISEDNFLSLTGNVVIAILGIGGFAFWREVYQ
jgi:hypothetical protein